MSDERRRRQSTRLRGYDYASAGAYLVTICTRGQEPLLATVVEGETRLTATGRLIEQEWLRTPELRRNTDLDVYVIMPNHVHGIIVISDEPPVFGGTMPADGVS